MVQPPLVSVVLGDEFVAELAASLRDAAEPDLAAAVPHLRFHGWCSCGDRFCQSFRTAPAPDGAYGPGHRNVCLTPRHGMLILDVVGDTIMFVEVLDRPELRERLRRS